MPTIYDYHGLCFNTTNTVHQHATEFKRLQCNDYFKRYISRLNKLNDEIARREACAKHVWGVGVFGYPECRMCGHRASPNGDTLIIIAN